MSRFFREWSIDIYCTYIYFFEAPLALHGLPALRGPKSNFAMNDSLMTEVSRCTCGDLLVVGELPYWY